MAQSLAQFGQTIKAKHPEYRDLSDEDVATKVLAKYPQYRDMVEPAVAGAGPLGLPQPQNPAVDMQKSYLAPAALALGDVAKGAAKGLLSTSTNISKGINKIPYVGETLAPSSGIRAAEMYAQPNNTAQTIGKVGEQAGEFLLPGAGEEAAAAKLAPLVGKALPAVKMGLAALGSGTVNAAQGGSFGTGALAGGLGSGVAQGLKAVAPAIAESALNIRKLDRAYKQPRAIGKAILNETTGLAPGTVAESAQNKINELNPELDRVLRTNSIADVDMASPRGIVADAQQAAATKNASTAYKQLEPLADQLSTRFRSGAQIPQNVSPTVARSLKQGIGEEFVHRWNPDTLAGTQGTAARVYHDLSSQIHSAAPGSGELDRRMGALIPVALRGESAELNAPTTQKIIQRIAAPTGALVGPLAGGAAGYEHDGAKGAMEGAAAGLLGPALLTTPTGQMILARMLNQSATPAMKLLVGSGLQMSERNNTNTSKVPQ